MDKSLRLYERNELLGGIAAAQAFTMALVVLSHIRISQKLRILESKPVTIINKFEG